MKSLIPRAAMAVLCLALVGTSVFAGPYHTKVIGPSDDSLVISVAENVFLQIRNFTQVGGVARGVVNVTINEEAVNVLSASQINSTSLAVTPEVINRVVIAGPATVEVDPVAGATLAITYRKVREGSPGATPTPSPTATPTVTPTPTVAH